MAFRFKAGDVWAGFKLEALLGTGRVGDTYRAKRVADGVAVALKIANPLLSSSREFSTAFQKQARILQRVKHAGVVPVLDVGVLEGVPFCAMPFVNGPREEPCTLKQYLAERLERGKPATEEEVSILVTQLCAAVEALHAHRDEDCPAGLSLGDLRPANVLLDAETAARIVDAGFGNIAQAGRATTIGAVRPVREPGDLDYMSPEYRDGQPPDVGADVYSLGAIAYELLTGAKVAGGAALPSKVRKDIRPGWDALLLEKALAFQPDQRFPDVRTMRKAVEKLVEAPRGMRISMSAGGSTVTPRTVLTIPPAPKHGAGSSTVKPATIPPTPSPAVPSASPKQKTAIPPAETPAPPEAKKRRRAPLWIAAAVLLIAATSGGVWALLHGGKKAAKPAKPATAAAKAATNGAVPAVASAPKDETKPHLIDDLGMKLMWIPPGMAVLGSASGEREMVEELVGASKATFLTNETVREARLARGFWLGETEVTVAQWRKFVEARPAFKSEAEERKSAYAVNEQGATQVVQGISWRIGAGGKDAVDTHPVVLVGATDAEAFCTWLTERERAAGRLPAGHHFRLPKAAEWEYAARGGAQRRERFWWGSKLEDGEGRLNAAGQEFAAIASDAKKTAFPWKDAFVFTAPVASFGDKGRNEFGLQDMLGNVCELCYNGTNRAVIRGGCFMDGADWCRSASFRTKYPGRPNAFTGFRVALAATPGK